MLLAELSGTCARSASSDSACLARRWQSSKLPSTRNVRTLSPQHPRPCAWRGETRPSGYRITTSKPGRRWNAAATAAPVSPEVATRIVVGGRIGRAQPRQRLGEEARGVVLERGGGAVEQLEQVVVVAGQRSQRCRERVGVRADVAERVAQRRVARSTARARACAVSASVAPACDGRQRGMRSGTYRPPSGARPATSAWSMPVGGVLPRVLVNSCDAHSRGHRHSRESGIQACAIALKVLEQRRRCDAGPRRA